MSRYGKALGSFRRINNIKRATENIQEARSMIAEKESKARNDAHNLMLNKNIGNNIAEIMVKGGMAVSQNHFGDSISPEMYSKISAGASGIAAGANNMIFSGGDISAGLSREEHRNFRDMTNNNIGNAALHGYTFQDLMNENRKNNQIDQNLEDASDNQFGFSRQELSRTARNQEWQPDVGYSNPNLAEDHALELHNQRVRRGEVDDPGGFNWDAFNIQDFGQSEEGIAFDENVKRQQIFEQIRKMRNVR